MDFANLETLNRYRLDRIAAVTVTDINTGVSHVATDGQSFEGALGDAVAAALRSGKSGSVTIEDATYFVNAYLPAPRIVIIGAVHITQTLAQMAQLTGFDVSIIDPRTAFATTERFSQVDLIADWPEDVLKTRPLDAHTALVAVTHDPKIDDFPLADALRTGCFYVGALGSRKTHRSRVERLMHQGLTEADIARIHAPIGLDIGAASPAEIAVAILAEIISALRCGNAALSKRDG
ncbi:XdhC family protein [Agrobacterium rubi]|uniref:XdhC/CoxF family protein n=1 Tax=Agrobacterium rubi TaxID=28099 RepID=A0AAE7UQC5_9HYPH|nr:XdhC family protein [Agrobacterium rubi]NTE88805.1 XdhC/CoxF family protein [Agrobacterium rubi]NTF04633.1 XdhC/CoxF family protein [Agrobacterium rubi]NTF39195.1 XdhC/CoxF family protein [Agrobacterium rubi]OCJ51298.1 XdhC/CoxF family protein [Agrobacterium rubi]QTG02843.1 XdhC/CoxF family protein [Agrobacterium rubi]